MQKKSKTFHTLSALSAKHYSSSFELILFWIIREFTEVQGRQHQSPGLTNLFAKVTNKCLDWGSLTDEDVFSASWVQLNGIKYQPCSLLFTNFVQENITLFTKVEGIVKNRQKWYIGGHDVPPESFDLKNCCTCVIKPITYRSKIKCNDQFKSCFDL